MNRLCGRGVGRLKWMLAASLAMAVLEPAAAAAAGDAKSVAEAVAALRRAAGASASIATSPRTGGVIFLSAGEKGLALAEAAELSPQERARVFVDTHGVAFGLRGSVDTKVVGAMRDDLGMDHVRFQQVLREVPVTAGGLVVHLRGDRVMAVNGEILAGADAVDPRPRIDPAEAEQAVRRLSRKVPALEGATLSAPRLEILNRGLLQNGRYPSHLAWFVEATGPALREFIWVDAHRGPGRVLLHFSQLDDARSPRIEDVDRADDVVAHERTHGVIDREAGLFHYMQSGALSESFADVFGETEDLTNGEGNDEPSVRWLVGEDEPGPGAFRSLMDPTRFGAPGKMTDPQYHCGKGDSGGVHVNGGIPSHAYALMSDGGVYDGHTIAGVGLATAARVHHRALAEYLLPGSDFLDAYLALKQSCADLAGTSGITAADCSEVARALDAVQMSHPVPCAQPPAPEFCPVGQVPTFLYYDDLEDIQSGRWVTETIVPTPGSSFNHWNGGFGTPDIYWNALPASGQWHFWGWGVPDVGDSTVAMAFPFSVSPGPPTYMQFNHWFEFENAGPGIEFDGGVMEYRTGGTWIDASGMFSAGATYNGTIHTCCNNPLGGRSAFTRESFGYMGTQLNISGLVFQQPRFRFRVGTDFSVSDVGWFVDDVRFYTCAPPVLTVDDLALPEGTAGNTTAAVTVRLSGPSLQTVTVNFGTVDGTALAGQDYVATSGTVTIPPGATSGTAPVTVNGDATVENNEFFLVNLSGAVGATLADSQATVTILDDETTSFYTLPPCRLADTRDPGGPSGGPALVGGTVRLFPVAGRCGVPDTAKAVAINVTVVGPNSLGNLRLYPAHAVLPGASTINFLPGWIRANNAITPLGASGFVAVRTDMSSGSSGSVHFVLDVSGYFQ